MNTVDLILLLVFLISIWGAIAKGFFVGVAGLISWLGSLLATVALYGHIAEYIENNITKGVWVVPLVFLFTLLIIGSLFSTIAGKLLNKVPLSLQKHRLNYILGVMPGVFIGLFYTCIAATLLLMLPISDMLTRSTRESKLAEHLTTGLVHFEQPFAPSFDAVNRSINNITIEPSSSKSLSLPFSVENPRPRPDLESAMLDLLNEERIKENLPPLTLDPELTPVAREHSKDMFARSFFSHISPEGATPFDRIRKSNISFTVAGENLALAQTLTLAHQGLMNSPGHRANILRKNFGRVGIGILDGGIHGLMITQKFRNK